MLLASLGILSECQRPGSAAGKALFSLARALNKHVLCQLGARRPGTQGGGGARPARHQSVSLWPRALPPPSWEGRFGETCPVCVSVSSSVKPSGLTVVLRADGGRPSQGPARAWPLRRGWWVGGLSASPTWSDFTGHSPQRCSVKPLLPGPGLLTGLQSPLLLLATPVSWGEGGGRAGDRTRGVASSALALLSSLWSQWLLWSPLPLGSCPGRGIPCPALPGAEDSLSPPACP